MDGAGLFIGKAASQAGTNPKTIRYYEAIGLLPPPHRGENRYRLFTKETVELLQFIKKAQELDLTLAEIKEIVDLRRRGHAPCAHVRCLLQRKITDLDQRLTELIALKSKLKSLLARSDRPARSSRRVGVCPHIEGMPSALEPRR